MTQNATPTQGSYQAPEGFETDHPQAAVGATFQRPVPNVRQQLQAQRAAPTASSVPNPAHYQGAQPQPVQPGGQGPLSGYASGVSAPAQPAPQQPVQAQPQPAPQMQAPAPEASDPIPGGSAEAFAAQPFAHAPRRPSFPAAPSKVLAEQQALGGDGHIRDTEPAPAFDAPMEGPYLEGAYPAPEAAPASTQAAPYHTPTQPGRAVPRYQHTDAAYSVRAPQAEPTLNDPSLDQRGDQDSAFWAFSAGAEPTHDRPRWGLIVALLLAVLLLLGLLAFAAWSQFRAAPAPADPIRLTAEPGPEWIVPADPGGLQVADQDLGVLNPDAIRADGSLTAAPIATVQPAPIPSFEETLIIEEAIEVPAQATVSPIATTPAEANPETTEPVIVDATPVATQPEGVPLPRPEAIPARAVIPAAEATTPAPEPQTPAASTPVAVESGVITTPPTGLYVQEGAYSTLANAQRAFDRVKAQGGAQFSAITPLYHSTSVGGAPGYKLYLIGFDTSAQAALTGRSLGRTVDNWFIRNG